MTGIDVASLLTEQLSDKEQLEPFIAATITLTIAAFVLVWESGHGSQKSCHPLLGAADGQAELLVFVGSRFDYSHNAFTETSHVVREQVMVSLSPQL